MYRYCWKNNDKRKELHGRLCKVICRLRMNSVVIEFLDNKEQVCTSRYAIREAQNGSN